MYVFLCGFVFVYVGEVRNAVYIEPKEDITCVHGIVSRLFCSAETETSLGLVMAA